MSDSARATLYARLRDTTAELQLDAREIAARRQALGSAPAAELPADELCEAFIINAMKNNATVSTAQSRSEAVQAIAQFLLREYKRLRLAACQDPRLAAMPWRDAGVLPRFGVIEGGEPVAVSFAQLGIAELGAVVTYTGKANPARNNLLPDHHLVILDADDLVTDMEKAWQRMNAALLADDNTLQNRPRGINIIAGPSSSADIDGKLIYGAHGPRGLHIILLGDVPKEALQNAKAIYSGV